MSMKQRLADDLKHALKSMDKHRANVLRMLRSRIQEAEVELRATKGRDYELVDDEVIEVLGRYAKQRRDSIESYRKGGRDDLADREQVELEIVESYLPEQLDDARLEEIVRGAVEETGATSQRDVGKVMSAVMPRVKGVADGKRVNEAVRRVLAEL